MRPFPAAAIGFLALLSAPSARSDPNALWHIVDQKCVPNQRHYETPLPCISARLDLGYVIMKDRVGPGQLLVMPTARITGIEDEAVLSPAAPNYFLFAWDAGNMVRALVGRDLPDDALSLAINSEYGRTQNQLHIHIDCLAPDVRAALIAHRSELTRTWSRFPVPLAGHQYWARTVETLAQLGETPFQLVAAGLQGARAHMGAMTIAVTATTDPLTGPEFILLAQQAEPPADRGSAEELQDHSCALARGN